MKNFLKMSLKICILIAMFGHSIVSERLLYAVTDNVGAGNFTHYTLKQEGIVTLFLDSIYGDADIYISETNSKPDYMDYDLQSATCGQDVVTIPKTFNRPLGIGIFGHVYHPVSKYKLTVVLNSDGSTISDEEQQAKEGSNESTLWVIFVNLLKIIVEILA